MLGLHPGELRASLEAVAKAESLDGFYFVLFFNNFFLCVDQAGLELKDVSHHSPALTGWFLSKERLIFKS